MDIVFIILVVQSGAISENVGASSDSCGRKIADCSTGQTLTVEHGVKKQDYRCESGGIASSL